MLLVTYEKTVTSVIVEGDQVQATDLENGILCDQIFVTEIMKCP